MVRRMRIPAGVLAALIAVPAVLALAVAPASAQTPPAPTVTANASATSSATMEVTFSRVDGALGYLVVPQRLRADGEWTALTGRIERLSDRRPVVFDGLVNGTTYRACVAAIMPDGARVGLSPSAIPYGLPGAPAISSVERAGGTLTVTWSPAAANGRQITAYEVSVAPNDVSPVIVGGSETSAVIEGLRDEAEYVVSVRATNLRGQGPAGQSAAAALPASAAADAPPVVTVAAVAPGTTGDTGGTVGDVLLVAEAGACAGATSPAGTTGDGTTPGGTGGGTTSATEEAADTEAAAPAATPRPAAPAEEDTDEPEADEPTPTPAPDAPAPDAPGPAPEVAAPEPVQAVDEPAPGRSLPLIVVALLGLAGVVIGGVVVQQRLAARTGTA